MEGELYRLEMAARVAGDYREAIRFADYERGGLNESLRCINRAYLSAAQERDILLQWIKDYYDRMRHEKNYAVADTLRDIVRASGRDLAVGPDGLAFVAKAA